MKAAYAVAGIVAGVALVAALWIDADSTHAESAPTSDVAATEPAPQSERSAQAQETAAPASERSNASAPPAAEPSEPTPGAPPQAAEAPLDSDACFASIMSNEPDLVSVTQWAERFAAAMEVDPASVEVDPNTGRVKGRFIAPAGLGAATFSINGERFEVSIWPAVSGPDAAPTPLRSMFWRFNDEGGTPSKPSLSLQNHPDTSSSVNDFVGERDERVVGWNFAATDRGAQATPVVARIAPDEPGAWIIGRPQSTPSADWPSYFIDGSHKILLGKLAPYAKK